VPRVLAENRYLGANVRRLRDRADLSQAELAEQVGISVVALSRIERGTVDVYLSTVVRLAQALSVKPGRLLEAAKLPPARIGRRKLARARTSSP